MSTGWFDNASCLQTPYKMIMNEDDSFIRSKQGIVSLLSSDFNNSSSSFNNNSIRRTLSAADMSSPQKWITPHSSPSSFKRVHSSLALGEHHHNNIDDDNNYDHDNNNNNNDNNNNVGGQAFEEIWSSIQADKKSWGSILSPGKTDGSGSGSGSKSGSEPGQLPAPYVHPLAKRSSSLSEKSLEICTESLGSETGSDGFSYPPSDPEDEHEHVEEEQKKEKEKEKEQEEVEEKGNVIVEVGNYNYKCNNNNNSLRGPTVKRSMMVPLVRPSFPPPLPSLAHRDDGSNLHIRSHRQDGRLVVEAVAVPSQNCFRAQRQDGRLLLTLSTSTTTTDEHELEQSEEILEAAIVENYDHDEEVDEEEEEEEVGGEEVLAIPRGVMNVQRSCTAFTMSKLMELTNTRNNSTWPRKYNKTVIKTLDDNEEEIEDEEVDELAVTRSLPPQPRVSASTATAAAVALNAYEYYWRRSNSPAAAAVAMLNPLVGHKNNNKNCAPQVEKDDTKRNNNKLLYAAHNRKGEALAQQEVVLLKAAATGRGGEGGGATAAEKAEYLVPLMLRGCKEPKRSLLFWKPPCIATS